MSEAEHSRAQALAAKALSAADCLPVNNDLEQLSPIPEPMGT